MTFSRLVCFGLLVVSVLALQARWEAGWVRSWTHRALPVIRLGGHLPGATLGASPEEERIRELEIAAIARDNEILRLQGMLKAQAAFRDRFGERYQLTVAADIVFRRDSSPFRSTVYLDRGKSDGVAVGDAVVWGEALVGQVFRVYRDICQARVLTDPGMRVPVLVVEPTGDRGEPDRPWREQGVLVGTTGPRCRLEFVPWTTRLAEGMHLVTSGFGGKIPRGLVCGEVTEVGLQDAAPFLEVEVSPAIDLDRIERVLIVRRTLVVEEIAEEER